ncbi:MAG TPA: hypothetical protein VMU54_25240 [Planctomycetota bacterium]|nr:hypothetical protein [Planctomycetota bacterium]
MAGTSIIFHHPPPLQGGAERTIVIPVRYLGYIRLLLGVWLAIWGLMEIAFAWTLGSMLWGSTPIEAKSSVPLGVILVLLTLAGVFLAWRFLWVSKGREILQLSPDRLVLRREPAGGRPVEFDRARIRHLRVGSYTGRLVYPSWGRRFVGKGNCFIAFDYEGKIWQIARGLSHPDAEYIVSQLRSP